MWHSWFGMRTRPFTGPAAAEPFPRELRDNQVARLEEVVRQRDGFAAILGDAGSGKTFLLHRLAERLRNDFQLTWLGLTQLPNLAALHQTLLFDWSQDFAGKSEQELRLAVLDQALKQANSGRPTLLIVDDAQHLQVDHLEELRLLGNLETPAGRCLGGVFAGQATFGERLEEDKLASFTGQMLATLRLESWTSEETAQFVAWQLEAAGGLCQRIIEADALELLAGTSRGNPRQLKRLTLLALQSAAAAQQKRVDVEAVLAAAEDLGLAAEPRGEELKPASLKLPRARRKSA